MQIQKPNKIVFYFFLGIVVPCILLSYFAYRGVRNESAFWERRTINEHQKTANLMINNVDSFIAAEEQAMSNFVQQFKENRDVINFDSLKNSCFNHTLVHSIFSIDPFNKFTFLHPKPLYFPDKENQSFISSKNSSISNIINDAHRFEYFEKNYQKALEIYLTAMSQNFNMSTKAIFLSAIARLQRKNIQFKKAIINYQNLIKNYDNLIGPGSIPFGLAARLELGSLYLMSKDTLNAVDVYLEVYQNILESTWNLQKSQFLFFVNSVDDSLKNLITALNNNRDIKKPCSLFDTLNVQLKRKIKITEYLLTFYEKGGDLIVQKFRKDSLNNVNAPSQFFLQIQDRKYLISLIKSEGFQNVNSEKIWGVIWNIDNFRDQYLRSLLINSLELSDVYWQVLDNDNNIILQANSSEPGKKTVTTNFINNFPPWSIEIYQKDAKLIEQIINLRRSIYFYILLLVAGILGGGLVLTSYSINREIELAELKSDFVSTISHDLRSPLTSIRQMAEMLKTGRVPTKKRRQKYYGVIVDQSEKLSLLINNILDSSKMEEKKREFDFEVVNFGKLLFDILSVIKQRVRHEGYTLKTEIDKNLPEIVVDRSAISQVITNLVGNAIKYSNNDKRINVRSFTESDYVVVEIQDFGIGIKKDEINKIFKRFYRGSDESVRSRIKGSGLGLTLIKQIIDAHRGKVLVESILGKGSTFTIKIPV